MEAVFKALPLDLRPGAFRLLQIKPELSQQGQLTCEIFNTTLDDYRNNFIAGSYVWGPTDPRKSILLNGSEVSIGPNLFACLRVLRHKLNGHCIWIDAICIDQSNNHERNAQVKMMGEIYQNAFLVVSWLGPASGDLESAVDQFNDIWNQINDEDDEYDPENASTRLALDRLKQADLVAVAEEIARHTYWTRLWIAQEFVLAQDVLLQIGKTELSWYRLYRWVMLAFDNAPPMELELFRGICEQRRSRFTPHPFLPRSLASTFERTWYTHLPRDRKVPQDSVYALLGLIISDDDHVNSGELVDYDQSSWHLLNKLLKQCKVNNIFAFISSYVERLGLEWISSSSFVALVHKNGTEDWDKSTFPLTGIAASIRSCTRFSHTATSEMCCTSFESESLFTQVFVPLSSHNTTSLHVPWSSEYHVCTIYSSKSSDFDVNLVIEQTKDPSSNPHRIGLEIQYGSQWLASYKPDLVLPDDLWARFQAFVQHSLATAAISQVYGVPRQAWTLETSFVRLLHMHREVLSFVRRVGTGHPLPNLEV